MLGQIQQHRSVARNILRERFDNPGCIQIALAGLVVPIRDAGFGLERIRPNIRLDYELSVWL